MLSRLGVSFGQSAWGERGDTAAMDWPGIVPIVNYKLAKGWYISNGDMVAQYDWESGQLYIPIAFRLGKVIVKAKHTWNFYGEYRTSLVYKGWNGSAVKNSYRINATYSIPVG